MDERVNKMNLLIVESPHKAETISNFLKGDFRVVATKGHIKNLPKHDLGVEKKEDKYFGDWQLDKEKTKLLSEIKELAKESQKIYIATDDDREGERIGWDVVEYLKLKTYYRIIFHEISKNAVEIAINEARLIDKNIINAQMARRIIDRIVGYPVSDTIRWHFIKNKIVPYDTAKKLGIGRVTAPALKLIIENEKKIENFEPKHYKKIAIDYYHDGIFFRVKNKLKFDPQTQDKELSAFLAILNNPANKHVVEQYKRDIKEISPPPPLTTTWMQRAANYLFSFKPDYTMKIAQELYENGLITYMRTDSHHISEEKIHEIYNVVFNTFGEEYLLTEKRYKDDEKAHESIRPVYFSEEYYPKKLKFKLSKDQYKLYRFIFLRTLAVFMKPALYDRSSITVSIEGNKFIAYSNVLEFEGWEKIGKIWRKAESDDIDEEIILPKTLNAGDILDPIEVSLYDYETRRPPRFGVGRFLTTLEQLGIARPSTIATILPNLEKKGFIKIMNNFIIPENLGKKTIDFLDEYAQWLTDTANAKLFEEALDMIERGELEKDDLIKGYEKLKDEFQESVGFEEFQIP